MFFRFLLSVYKSMTSFPVINQREQSDHACAFLPHTSSCLVSYSHDWMFTVDEARLVKFFLQEFANSAVLESCLQWRRLYGRSACVLGLLIVVAHSPSLYHCMQYLTQTVYQPHELMSGTVPISQNLRFKGL